MKLLHLFLLCIIVPVFSITLSGKITNRSFLPISDTTMLWIRKVQLPDTNANGFSRKSHYHFIDSTGSFVIKDDSITDIAEAEELLFATEAVLTLPSSLSEGYCCGRPANHFPVNEKNGSVQNFTLVERVCHLSSLGEVKKKLVSFEIPPKPSMEGFVIPVLPEWNPFVFEYRLSIGEDSQRVDLGEFVFRGKQDNLPEDFPDTFFIPCRGLIPEEVTEFTESFSFKIPFGGSFYTLFDSSRTVSVSDFPSEMSIDFLKDTDWERIYTEFKRNEDRRRFAAALRGTCDSLKTVLAAILAEGRISPNDSTLDETTFIHAVKNPGQIVVLIDLGADHQILNDDNGRTHTTIWDNLNRMYRKSKLQNPQRAKECVRAMEELVQRGIVDNSLLSFAAIHKEYQLLEKILNTEVDIMDLDSCETPFLSAIAVGDTTALKMFLTHDTDPVKYKRKGVLLPLDYVWRLQQCCDVPNLDRMESLLLDAGAVGEEYRE